MRIISSRAFLTNAFEKVGLSGDVGGTFFMTQLIGAAKARQLYFLSERVTADEAVQLGLANWSYPQEEFEACVRDIAHGLAAGAAVALRYMKEYLNRAMGGSMEDCLALEANEHHHCYATAEHPEADTAFIEKRAPEFTSE